MKKKYSKEEKAAYFKNLRKQWSDAKALANNDQKDEISAIIKNYGLNISITGYCMIAAQMRAQGLEGIPYLDAKTFLGWQDNGFMVRKGEKSTLHGCSWKNVNGKDNGDSEPDEGEEDRGYMLPVAYHLFHRSQVEAI